MLEKLSNIIHMFIEENDILDMDDFSFMYRMIEIFEKNYKHNSYECHKKNIPFERSYKYSYDFLESINPNYAQELEKLRASNNIELFMPDKNEDRKEYYHKFKEKTNLELVNGDGMIAYTVNDSGTNRILMSPCNTLIDSYVLTHEFFHTISLSPDESLTASIFCESLTFLSELLQDEYFKEHNIKEHYKNKYELLRVVYEHVEGLKIKFELINICLNHSIITVNDLKSIFIEYRESEEILFSCIDAILNNDDVSILDDERYAIGIIFAYYMFDRINTDKRNIREFMELNEMLDYYIPEEFVSYLGLEYVEESDIFKLTEESYQQLEKSFVKVLKGRY